MIDPNVDYLAGLRKRRLDRFMWHDIREKHGTVTALRQYLYRYTNDADKAIEIIDALLLDRTPEWLDKRDLGYLLDRMDTCIEIINGNPLYLDEY